LKISNKGLITFASGQTFPGAGGSGTITGVKAGTALTGGGTSGTVTLNLNTAEVPMLAAANNFTGSNAFNVSGSTAISAASSAAGATVLSATASATSGGSNGIIGITYDGTGSGVTGIGKSTTIGGSGVLGIASLDGAGVVGSNNGDGEGVYGISNGTGVMGVGAGTFALGVWAIGDSAAAGSGWNGAQGLLAQGGAADPSTSNTAGGSAIVAYAGDGSESGGSNATGGDGILTSGGAGGPGAAGGDGMSSTGGNGGSGAVGGDGISSTGGNGGSGSSDGMGAYVQGGSGASFGDGIYAKAGNSTDAWAGDFNGDVNIAGSLSKASGSFKIDHPLDPANKYLYHSFVESPDMMNIYNGVATLDPNGEATITMPEWFSVLNRDFRYQLTCIGGFAPVYIAEELANNQFKIGGGHAGMKISWQITGIRQDAWANAHRIPLEEEKEPRLKGYYIHPELYGAPPEKQIEWARHPQTMKRMQQQRQATREKLGRPIPHSFTAQRSE
jgi:trimeric autotransporter adhesin